MKNRHSFITVSPKTAALRRLVSFVLIVTLMAGALNIAVFKANGAYYSDKGNTNISGDLTPVGYDYTDTFIDFNGETNGYGWTRVSNEFNREIYVSCSMGSQVWVDRGTYGGRPDPGAYVSPDGDCLNASFQNVGERIQIRFRDGDNNAYPIDMSQYAAMSFKVRWSNANDDNISGSVRVDFTDGEDNIEGAYKYFDCAGGTNWETKTIVFSQCSGSINWSSVQRINFQNATGHQYVNLAVDTIILHKRSMHDSFENIHGRTTYSDNGSPEAGGTYGHISNTQASGLGAPYNSFYYCGYDSLNVWSDSADYFGENNGADIRFGCEGIINMACSGYDKIRLRIFTDNPTSANGNYQPTLVMHINDDSQWLTFDFSGTTAGQTWYELQPNNCSTSTANLPEVYNFHLEFYGYWENFDIYFDELCVDNTTNQNARNFDPDNDGVSECRLNNVGEFKNYGITCGNQLVPSLAENYHFVLNGSFGGSYHYYMAIDLPVPVSTAGWQYLMIPVSPASFDMTVNAKARASANRSYSTPYYSGADDDREACVRSNISGMTYLRVDVGGMTQVSSIYLFFEFVNAGSVSFRIGDCYLDNPNKTRIVNDYTMLSSTAERNYSFTDNWQGNTAKTIYQNNTISFRWTVDNKNSDWSQSGLPYPSTAYRKMTLYKNGSTTTIPAGTKISIFDMTYSSVSYASDSKYSVATGAYPALMYHYTAPGNASSVSFKQFTSSRDDKFMFGRPKHEEYWCDGNHNSQDAEYLPTGTGKDYLEMLYDDNRAYDHNGGWNSSAATSIIVFDFSDCNITANTTYTVRFSIGGLAYSDNYVDSTVTVKPVTQSGATFGITPTNTTYYLTNSGATTVTGNYVTNGTSASDPGMTTSVVAYLTNEGGTKIAIPSGTSGTECSNSYFFVAHRALSTTGSASFNFGIDFANVASANRLAPGKYLIYFEMYVTDDEYTYPFAGARKATAGPVSMVITAATAKFNATLSNRVYNNATANQSMAFTVAKSFPTNGFYTAELQMKSGSSYVSKVFSTYFNGTRTVLSGNEVKITDAGNLTLTTKSALTTGTYRIHFKTYDASNNYLGVDQYVNFIVK